MKPMKIILLLNENIFFQNVIQRYLFGLTIIIFCLSISELAAECFTVGENGTFYK